MSKSKNKSLAILLVFALIFSVFGFLNTESTYAASKKIHLKKTTVKLVTGKTYQQKLIDKKGKTIKATKVKWKSKKTSVAKINKKGKITAVKAGTAKMTAKYKGKTYKFKVKVTKATSKATKIYNYVKENGFSVNNDYLIPGNRCIESDVKYGSDHEDIFIISIDTSDKSKIYFSSFRTKYCPADYDDTTETTTLQYGINSSKGHISFIQEYYLSSSSSSWGMYLIGGTLTYKNYLGSSSYLYEKGITGMSKGTNDTPVDVGDSDSKELIEGAQLMTSGVDKLLSSTLGIRLREIGFTKL